MSDHNESNIGTDIDLKDAIKLHINWLEELQAEEVEIEMEAHGHCNAITPLGEAVHAES